MRRYWIRRQLQLALRRVPFLFPVLYYAWRLFQPKVTMGAVGVLFDERGHILLVEHAFHPKTPWGLPGGWVARRENPADTVQREIKEELSLDVEVGPVILAEMPFANHLDLAYLCRTKDTVGDLSYEIITHDWIPPDQLPRLLSFHNRAVQRAIRMIEITEYHKWLQH